jgi:hypothetical protein
MADENQGGTPATTTTTETPSTPSIAEIMAFDPFSPPEEPAAQTPPAGAPETPANPADDPGQQSGKAETTPPVTDPNAQQPAPVTPPQPAPDSNQQLLQEIRDQLARQQQPPQASQPQQPPPAQPQAPKYNLAIPPQIVDALRSEDPNEFAVGMTAVINGISNRIWQDVQQHLTSEFAPQLLRHVQAQQTESTQLQTISQDFFSAHPNLNNDIIKPMLQQAGAMVIQERQAAGKPTAYTAEVRDAIAERIYAVLPNLRPQPAQGQQQQPQPAKPAQQRFATGVGTRPPAPATQDEFTDVLKSF